VIDSALRGLEGNRLRGNAGTRRTQEGPGVGAGPQGRRDPRHELTRWGRSARFAARSLTCFKFRFMDFRVCKRCFFGIWVRSSKIKLPVGQASPGNLLSFADCQVRASFRVVGNALFFAKSFYFVYV
jgi:hypothetical protein